MWTRGAVIARRYRLLDEATDRGLTETWRAQDTQRPPREVAVSRFAGSHPITASRSDHPDVLAPLDAGLHDGDSYVVTAWREGVSLERWLDRFEHRRPPTRTAWRCFARICAVMETLHRAREGERVHGWLSPRSLLVLDGTADTADQLAVMDLGLASGPWSPAWRRPDGVSHAAWLAPERVDGAPASPASDVFALAVVMAELLTGHPLAVVREGRAWWQLARDGDIAVLARLRALRPELMGAPIDLVAQALSATPARRFPDASVFRKALRQAGVKMAVEHAGTAVLRAPHRIEHEEAHPKALREEEATEESTRGPFIDELMTVPEEVSPFDAEFRAAFAEEDEALRTEPVTVQTRGPDLFDPEKTVDEIATTPVIVPRADPLTLPIEQAFAASMPHTEPLAPVALPAQTTPFVPTPKSSDAGWILAAVAIAVALIAAAVVYVLAR